MSRQCDVKTMRTWQRTNDSENCKVAKVVVVVEEEEGEEEEER